MFKTEPAAHSIFKQNNQNIYRYVEFMNVIVLTYILKRMIGFLLRKETQLFVELFQLLIFKIKSYPLS